MDQETLKYLLLDLNQPKVVAIDGKWGVGKTYFWQQFSKEHLREKSIYVSLFRMTSLEDLDGRIARELLFGQDEAKAKQHLKSLGSAFGKLTGSFLGSKGLALPSSFISEMILREKLEPGMTVCLDDLERTGIGLVDLLGYVDELREKFGTNVVLVFNGVALDDPKTRTMLRYHEKVIDRALPFVPDIKQCVVYGIEDADLHEFVTEHCELLGLDNIRVIRRVDSLAKEVARCIGPDQWIASRKPILHSLILFCYVHFVDQQDVDGLDRLRTHDGLKELGLEGLLPVAPDSDKEKKIQSDQREFLNRYRFYGADSLDDVLIDFVKNGALDQIRLRSSMVDFADREATSLRVNEVTGIWVKYFHSSFQPTEAEFVGAITAFFEKHYTVMSLSELGNVISGLEVLGHDEAVDDMIRRFIDSHRERLLGTDGSPRVGIYSERLRTALKDLFSTSKDDRPLGEVADSVLGADSWNAKDLDRLSVFSVDDWLCHFRSADRDYLRTNQARELLKWASEDQSSNEAGRDWVRKGKEALKILVGESNINRARLSEYLNDL